MPVRFTRNPYAVRYRRYTGSVLRRGRFYRMRRRARPLVVSLGGRRRYASYHRAWLRNHRYMWLRNRGYLRNYG